MVIPPWGITRIGAFNAVSDGEYLSYSGDIGHLQVLPRQPDAGIMASSALQGASSGFTKVGIDPTGGVGGQVLANLVNFPTVEEQVRIIRELLASQLSGLA